MRFGINLAMETNVKNWFWMKETFTLVKKLLHFIKEKSENTKENSTNHNFQVLVIKQNQMLYNAIGLYS